MLEDVVHVLKHTKSWVTKSHGTNVDGSSGIRPRVIRLEDEGIVPTAEASLVDRADGA